MQPPLAITLCPPPIQLMLPPARLVLASSIVKRANVLLLLLCTSRGRAGGRPGGQGERAPHRVLALTSAELVQATGAGAWLHGSVCGSNRALLDALLQPLPSTLGASCRPSRESSSCCPGQIFCPPPHSSGPESLARSSADVSQPQRAARADRRQRANKLGSLVGYGSISCAQAPPLLQRTAGGVRHLSWSARALSGHRATSRPRRRRCPSTQRRPTGLPTPVRPSRRST